MGSGKKGTEVRKHFGGARYGGPQDAVDAALIVLYNAGAAQARIGSEPVAKGKLDQKNIAAAEFRVETVTLTTVQLIAIRSLFKSVGLNTQPGQESQQASEFLNRLRNLAESAGGDAPLPKRPDTSHISDLANRIGNDQLKAILDSKDQLTKQVAAWQRDRGLIEERLPRWNQLAALLKFANELPVAAEVQPELAAIEHDRKLLANPDPVPGMIEKLSGALRTALNEAHGKFLEDHEARMTTLAKSTAWMQIAQPQRHEILSANGIRLLPAIAVGTTDKILDTLRHTWLSEVRAISDALPTRFNNAMAAAAKLLEPKAQHVSLPAGTIKNEDELKAWLLVAEASIREKLKDGPVVI